MTDTEYGPKRPVRRYETPPDGYCLCGCGGRPKMGGFLPGHWNKTETGRALARRTIGSGPRPSGREHACWKGGVAARLAARLAPPNASGCVEWTGPCDRHGYARITDDEHHVWLVHRLAYVLAGNELQDDQELHHACFNRACCTPEHLIPMPHSEHSRLHARLRQKTPEQRLQGECRNGHSLVEYGFIYPCGRLVCGACLPEANRRRNEKRRAARAEARIHRAPVEAQEAVAA